MMLNLLSCILLPIVSIQHWKNLLLAMIDVILQLFVLVPQRLQKKHDKFFIHKFYKTYIISFKAFFISLELQLARH